MNKAGKFDKFLAENKITCFSKEGVKNDLHTVVYRAHMEVSGQMLPTMVVCDDSIYTMIQVRVAAAVINEGNKQAVLEHINSRYLPRQLPYRYGRQLRPAPCAHCYRRYFKAFNGGISQTDGPCMG